jgi:hypothetical protein
MGLKRQEDYVEIRRVSETISARRGVRVEMRVRAGLHAVLVNIERRMARDIA